MAQDYVTRLKADTSDHDKAINKSSDEVKKYGKSVNNAGKDVRKLLEQERKAKLQYEANQKALKQYGLAMSDFKNQVSGVIKGYIGFAAAAGALSSALKYNIETATKFSEAISQLSSLTGLKGDDLNYLKDAAIKLGSTTTQSASEVVNAFKLIGSQKPELLKSKEALVEVTKAAITLSEAASIGVEDAAKALTMSLNQMGVSGYHANEYINILAAGSKEGAADINYLSTAIEKCGSMAASTKIPFNQLIAIIESVAPKFSSADVAGSQLQSTLLKLATQTNNNFNPAIVGYRKAIENLAKAEMSDLEIKNLVGESNVSMIKALISARGEQDRLTKAITDTNTAEEQAKTNTDNFAGSVKSLESAWEGLNLAINETNGYLKTAVDWATRLLGVYTNLIKYGWGQGKIENYTDTYNRNDTDGSRTFSNKWTEKYIKGDGTIEFLNSIEALENRRKKLIDGLYEQMKSINKDGMDDDQKRVLDNLYMKAIDQVNQYIETRKQAIIADKAQTTATTELTTATTQTTSATTKTTKQLTDLEKAILNFKQSLTNAKNRANALNLISGLTEMTDIDYYSEQLNIVGQELNAYKQKLENVGELTDEEKNRVIELNNERKKLAQKLKKEQEAQRYKEDYQKRTDPQNITNALFGNGKPAEEILKSSIEEIAKTLFSDSTKARLYVGDTIWGEDGLTPEIKQKTITFLSPKRSWDGWKQTPTFEDSNTWNFNESSQSFQQYADEWVKWYMSLLKFESDIEDEIRNFIIGKQRVGQISPEQAKEISDRLFNVEDILIYIEDNPDLKEVGKTIVNAILNKEFIKGELDTFNLNPSGAKIKNQFFSSYQSGLNEQIENIKKQQGQLQLDKLTIPQDAVDSVLSYGDAWKSLQDVLNDENATFYDKLKASINVIQSAVDLVTSLCDKMNQWNEISKQLAAAKQTEIALSKQSAQAAAAEQAYTASATAAKSGEAIAGATASGAKLPFPYNIAAIAAGVSAVLSAIATIASFKDGGIIPRFDNGGVFKGATSIGDYNLARVNSGEMILNGSQQERLFRMLNSSSYSSNNISNGQVEFRIEGSTLYGVLNNYNKKRNKIL